MGNTKSISILLKKDEQTILQYLDTSQPLICLDKYNNTPLMILANRGMETAAIKLLRRYYYNNNDQNILKLLKQSYDHVYHRNKKRESVLSISCKLGLKRLAMELLNNFTYKKYDDNVRGMSDCFFIDAYGRTPLSYACESIEMEEVALRLILLNAGVSSGNDQSPLIIACKNRNVRVARKLITILPPAVINYVDKNGVNALSISCRLGLSDVALDIIKNECLSSLQNNNLALLNSCKNSMEEVAIALIKSGKCYLECKDGNEFTPLHYACKNKLENVVNELLERTINSVTIGGEDSPFIRIARETGNLTILNALGDKIIKSNTIPKEGGVCVVCFKKFGEKRYTIVPCGHSTVCGECLSNNLIWCPICRNEIHRPLRIYLE